MRSLILLLIQVVALISLFTNSPAFAVNPCPPGMVMISGGTFKMGADDSGFEKEQTAENVTVSSFCIDKYEVTNAQFTEFVKATNYVTVAERPLSKEQFPDLSDEERLPGSLVFQFSFSVGGIGHPVLTGSIPLVVTAQLSVKKTTQLCILPTKMS
ncbi:MAG: hypothetical protein RLZZ86_1063 [Cyanobacteriota bacterium]